MVLHTGRDGLEGHGLTFTIGRGNDVCVAAAEALKPLVLGHRLESFTSDMAAFCGRAGRLSSSRAAQLALGLTWPRQRCNISPIGTAADLRQAQPGIMFWHHPA